MRRAMTDGLLLGLLGRLGLLGVLLAACGPGETPIPPGVQQVHVVVTPTEVILSPTTVRAGDVYLVLDAPMNGSFVFVRQKSTAAATPGPLSDDDLARLARRDTQGTAIEGLDAGGCSPDQDAASRGRLGPCGNVYVLTLAPGKYAVLGEMPEGGSPDEPPPIAVLEILP